MEKLDTISSRRPHLERELGIGICDPANEQMTLTRCTFGSTSQQPTSHSLSGKLGNCALRETNRLPTVAAGTGLYFHSVTPSNCTLNSDGDKFSELQDLFNLATVACEVESSVRHCQLAKKRRTPRTSLWINGSRALFAKFNGDIDRIELPAEAAVASRQRIGKVNIYSRTPWLEKSGRLESSAFSNLTNRKVQSCISNMVRERRCSESADKMICQPTGPMIKFNILSTAGKLLPTSSTDLSGPRTRRLPGQETRVQGFAKRILQFVGERRTEEKFIRGALGNNPDISKALRLLLKERKVKRLGHGGRGKAFLYMATPAGLRELEEFSHKRTSHGDFKARLRLILGKDMHAQPPCAE